MKHIILILFSSIVFTACKKAGPFAVDNLSLNVVNASPGVSNAKIKTPVANGFFKQLTGVNYGSNYVFTMPTGNNTISIYSSTDTTHALYSNTLTTGNLYSLFIGGSSGNDFILNQEAYPYHADSSFGVRFMNMSYNSSPVNVTLTSTPTTNEFSSVAYKSITNFKNYTVRFTDPSSYTFQLRDGSGNLFSPSVTITLSVVTYRFKNVTLVLKGAVGGSGTTALGLFAVPNY